MGPKKAPPLIGIVEENESVPQRLDRLIRSTGAQTSVFGSSHAFLRSYHSRPITCLVLGAHLSGVSGLELQRMLCDAKIFIPIVLMTASADVVRTGGLAPGAVEVVRTPFSDEELLSAITALASSARVRCDVQSCAAGPPLRGPLQGPSTDSPQGDSGSGGRRCAGMACSEFARSPLKAAASRLMALMAMNGTAGRERSACGGPLRAAV